MFLTRPSGNHVGNPLEAKACKCGDRQRLDEDGLCFCGFWPAETIRRTFARDGVPNIRRTEADRVAMFWGDFEDAA